MLYQIHENPKHGTDSRTAFLEQIRGYDPEWIAIVAGPNDLIDPDGPVALSNLPINSYHLRLVNVVKYVNGLQLWPVPGTTTDDLPVVNRQEVSAVPVPANESLEEDTAVVEVGNVD